MIRSMRILSVAFLLLALVALAGDAQASVSIAATYDGVIKESTAAVLVTPLEQRSVWENGRIYTYTRARIDRSAAGELGTGAEAWIRTMGGVVGKVGQVVDGEAVFTMGKPSLVFLHPGPVGAFEVTARAQGQFPLSVDEKKVTRLIKSGAIGAILPPKPGARQGQLQTQSTVPPALLADVVHGRPVDDVVRDVAAAWKRLHAK
jgi:hypothetical protein